jgi:hypothetical protein
MSEKWFCDLVSSSQSQQKNNQKKKIPAGGGGGITHGKGGNSFGNNGENRSHILSVFFFLNEVNHISLINMFGSFLTTRNYAIAAITL